MKSETRFKLRWATPDDEPEIRALVGTVPMPGGVSLIFAREPDYFLGAAIMGDPCDVLLVRQRSDGQLVGIACRAERRVYINRQESVVGYIGQIRIAESFRGNWLVHRGAKWFKDLSPPGLPYIGVIARENPRARKLLVGARMPGGLQVAGKWGLTTCAILLRPRQVHRTPGIEVQPGSSETLGEITAYLRLEGPRRQFFPAYTYKDFNEGIKLRGLKPEDIMVARRGNTIMGIMAVWDQAAYKQDIIDAYGPELRLLRPLYNLAARFIRVQPLTPPGQAIPLAFASCICVTEDDQSVMRALLSSCLYNAYTRGKEFLMVGLADNDPLLPVVRRHLHITYHSELFVVSWSGKPASLSDDQIPYIEIATL